MAIRVVEYHVEHDTIEVMHTPSEGQPRTRTATTPVWKNLLLEIETARKGLEIGDDLRQILIAIRDRGGIDWLVHQANETIEL